MHRLAPTVALAATVLVVLSACCGTRGRRCCRRRCATGTPSAIIAKAPPKAPDVWAFHAAKYDADKDGRITTQEYGRGEDAFKRLDTDKDDALTEADFADPMGMDRFISRMAVGRLFQADAEPELSLDEVRGRFAEIDTNGDNELSRRELEVAQEQRQADESLPIPPIPPGVDAFYALRTMADGDGNARVSLPEMETWFRSLARDGGEIWKIPRMPNPAKLPPLMQGGVAPGTEAPDFTLKTLGGKRAWTLSNFAKQKPVALIFGSYT